MRKVNLNHCDPIALGANCSDCPLYDKEKKRHKAIPVPDEIKTGSRLAIVTEAPGSKDEIAGSPLIGPSGNLIERTLRKTGSSRQQVTIANALLCRPPKNFSPVQWRAALDACRPRLNETLRIVQAKLIIAAGAKALQTLTGKAKITPWYGAPLETKYGLAFPTVHPAFVLRTPAWHPVFKNWIGRAVAIANGKLALWKWPTLVTEPPYEVHLEKLFDAKMLSIDIENAPSTGRIRCIGIGTSGLAVSVPLPPEGRASPVAIDLLKKLIASNIPKLFHNAAFDLKELAANGFAINGEIHDTLLMHAVTDPRLSHRLTDAAVFETHAPRWKTEHKVEGDDKGSGLKWFESSSLDELLPYNAKDVLMTAVLAERLQLKLDAVPRSNEQYQTYRELNNLAMRMRERGILVDKSKFGNHEKAFKQVLGEIREKFIELGIPRFNESDKTGYTLGKNGQHPSLANLFFNAFRCEPVSWSETTNRPSLDSTALNRYSQDERKLVSETARLIRAYRKNSKLLNSYIQQLPIGEDGAVHPSWRVFGTRTGRWSAKDPGMQTIPKENKRAGMPSLRDLFQARSGLLLVEADYSQLELRVVAELAQDDLLLEWYAAGLDVHRVNACEIFVTKDPTKQQRDMAKTVVYACVPMDTRALTRSGWKSYADLQVGELVLTYNAKTKQKEWSPILNLVKYENAEVFEMSHDTRGFKTYTTADHRWHVENRYGKQKVQTTAEISDESHIITNAAMGADLGSGGAADYLTLEKYGTNWTEKVCRMSSMERLSFLSGFLLADGHFSRDQWHWTQNQGDIAEALLTASYLEHSGHVYVNERNSPTNPIWNVRLGKKGHVTGQLLRKHSVGKMDVWCMTTANSSWVMRQGNCITITGNCNYGGGPDVAHRRLVVDYPNLKLHDVERVFEMWFRQHDKLKRWQDGLLAKAAKDGFVEAPVSGKRQYYYDGRIVPTEVLNFPIQATAGDIANKAILWIDKQLNWQDEAVLMQIHDSIVLEGTNQKRLVDILIAGMEQPIVINGKNAVFPVDVAVGDNWGHMVKLAH